MYNRINKEARTANKTISDFRKLYKKSFREIFRKFVVLLKEWELIEGETIAIDSFKIRAQNSLKNNFNEKKLDWHMSTDSRLCAMLKKMTTFDNEMINIPFTYHKDKLIKWLLMVTLFFSIFTFSGYSSNSQSKQKLATQSELLLSNNHKTGKRTISYKKAFELIRFDTYLNSNYTSWTNALFTYNLLTKIKLNNISRQFYLYKLTSPFQQVKTIPQSSDENIFEIYIG